MCRVYGHESGREWNTHKEDYEIFFALLQAYTNYIEYTKYEDEYS